MSDYYKCLARFALKNVPKEYRTKELCMEAIKHNAMALRHVPRNIMDKEICMKAVSMAGNTLHMSLMI